MTNSDLKRILWVDNNVLIHRDYQNEAKVYGLDLISYDCWDDAFVALKEDFDNWSAIILQPKSKLHAGGLRVPMAFLPQAFSDINVLCSLRGKTIPWYILTDIEESQFDLLVLECRNKWDSTWPKSYYDSSLTEERIQLFKRIKDQSERSERLQVRSGQYKKVFESLDFLYNYNLNREVGDIIEDFLVSTCYGNSELQDFGSLRRVLEYIFYSMLQNGLLPENMVNSNNNMNNNACSRLLSCKDTEIDGKRFSAAYHFMNEMMARNVFTMLKLGNYGHHATTNNESIILEEYLSDTQTNNMLNSCALQLCDIIIWYAETLKSLQKQRADTGVSFKWWVENEV